MEYVNSRVSTVQLISLQEAEIGSGYRSNTTQLQAKAKNFVGNSGIAQLKALGDAQTTSAKTTTIQRAENRTERN